MSSTSTDPWPRSHYDVIEHHYAHYDKQIASGEYQPYMFPQAVMGALVVIIYLLIPHHNRPWLRSCRYLVVAWAAGFAAYFICYTRAKSFSVGYGIGLVNVWGVFWTIALLLCNDAQADFMRIERIERISGTAGAPSTLTKGKRQEKEEEHSMDSMDSMDPKSTATMTKQQAEQQDSTTTAGTAGPASHHGQFAWQPYPLSPFVERLDWVLDLLANFRGAGWNWRTSALPPPPKWLQEQLRRNSADAAAAVAVPKYSHRIHAGQARGYTTRKELLAANAKMLLLSYLALDAIKTAMMWDPYFWGLVDRPPSPRLPAFLTQSAFLTKCWRLVLGMLGIKYSLQALFCVGALFFCGLCTPDSLGARAEPFMYPDSWGPFAAVLDGGLAGWWSNWWHQSFRCMLDQPGRKLLMAFGQHPNTLIGKMVQLGVAFGISGLMHAAGSYTIAGETNPIRATLAFFLWQAVGIFAEAVLTRLAQRAGLGNRFPTWLKRGLTFVYVHAWFYCLGPLVGDEAAKGGMWLVEPVPVSFFRGMGLSVDKRDRWLCESGPLLRWHSGKEWWNRGIAL